MILRELWVAQTREVIPEFCVFSEMTIQIKYTMPVGFHWSYVNILSLCCLPSCSFFANCPLPFLSSLLSSFLSSHIILSSSHRVIAYHPFSLIVLPSSFLAVINFLLSSCHCLLSCPPLSLPLFQFIFPHAVTHCMLIFFLCHCILFSWVRLSHTVLYSSLLSITH